MTTEVKFNINEHVRVKLTDVGRAWHREYMLPFHTPDYPYKPPKEDAEGWSRWQLHDLMQIFGSKIAPGTDLMFETDIILEATP